MKKLSLFLILFLFIYAAAYNQQSLQTVAEQSNYESTSMYQDVMQFISGLKKSSSMMRVEFIGVTAEGRDIPLMVIGDPLPGSPKDLENDDRIVDAR